jgi:hypothetical protein
MIFDRLYVDVGKPAGPKIQRHFANTTVWVVPTLKTAEKAEHQNGIPRSRLGNLKVPHVLAEGIRPTAKNP